MWPLGPAHLGPNGIIWANLVKVYKIILPIKYQGSRTCGFRQEYFFKYLCRKLLFSMCDQDMRQTRTIGTILKSAILVSFLPSLVKIQSLVKEELSFEVIVDDARYMIHFQLEVLNTVPENRLSAHQPNAIQMTFRWWADGGPRMYVGWKCISSMSVKLRRFYWNIKRFLKRLVGLLLFI